MNWITDTTDPVAVLFNLPDDVKDKLGIDFSVEKLGFPGLQTMDPRIVRIAPGKTNELHRHAHESLFVVLEGTAEIQVGEALVEVRPGGVAFVPRWQYHRTRNTGTEQLVALAVTDFGFCSALLGDYDRKHRGKYGGDDAERREGEPGEGSQSTTEADR